MTGVERELRTTRLKIARSLLDRPGDYAGREALWMDMHRLRAMRGPRR